MKLDLNTKYEDFHCKIVLTGWAMMQRWNLLFCYPSLMQIN